MRKIIRIISVEKRYKANHLYYITTILDDKGDESTGYGRGYEVGQAVQVFFDDKWDRVKFKVSSR